MLARGQITVTNLDDGKTPFLHQAYKMKDGRFLKHYPVYEAPPVGGYKEGDLWHWNGEDFPGRNYANKSSYINLIFYMSPQTFGVPTNTQIITGVSTKVAANEIYTFTSFERNNHNRMAFVISEEKPAHGISFTPLSFPTSEIATETIIIQQDGWLSIQLATSQTGISLDTKVKLEKGENSTSSWSPAPEDITGGKSSGYFVANKSNTTFDFNDWMFYADELAYSDTDKFYPKFEGTYSDYNEVASDDQTKYTWKIIKADDGIGIKSVKEYYAISTSNVTPPSLQSDWSETPRTTDTTNKYLWNYEVYTYSNGDSKETTKRVIGTHGATGATGATGNTGNGITSVTNRYLATTLATGVTTATSGWTTTVQKTDSVKKYLWNYEEILYTNGKKIPTAPVIIGTHGEKGDNSVVGVLTNESITLPANKDGLVSSTGFTGATGVFDVYDGITKKTGTGTAYSVVSQSNITVNINATGAYAVAAMPPGTTVLNGHATLRAVYNDVITIDKQLNVSKSVAGAKGDAGASSYTWVRYSPNANGSYMTEKPEANSLYIGVAITSENSAPEAYTYYTWALIKGDPGASATSYWVTASNNIISKSQTGTLSPTTIKFTGYSKTGTANSALYAGRFVIQTSENGSTYTTKYTSSANQTSYTYTIPAGIKFIKALMYQAGETTVLLDEQTVPVVESAEGIQVGGENILQNTSFQEGLKYWSVDSQHTTTVADGVITLKNQSGQRWPKLCNISPRLSEIKKGDIYTLSFEAKGDTRTGDGVALSRANASNTIFRKYVDYSPEWKRYTLTFTASLDWVEGVRLEVWTNRDASTSELTTSYRKFKLEKGTVATDWTPAPEDARTYKAWANSADGGADFTRVYPNENLWIDSLSESGYVVSNGDNIGDVRPSTDTHRIMPELVPVDGTEIVYQFWNPNKVVNISNSNRIAFFKEDKTFISYITNRLNGEAYKSESISLPSGTKYLRIGFIQGTPTDRDMAIKFKVEVGSTPTVYTTNTADSLTGSMMQYIGFSPLDSSNPSEYEWIINPEYTKALSDEATSGALGDINDSLAGKVDNSEFEKLEEVANTFAESYKAFVADGGQYVEDMKALEERFTQIFIELGGNTLDLNFLKTYMRAGEEGLLIGKEGAQIKMLLTNDRLSFQEGEGTEAKEIAYFSGQSFFINRGAVVEDIQIGEHKITNLGNGHTIFQWVGAV